MKNIGQCCHAVSEDERRDKHISQSHHPTSENSLATSSSTRSSLNELFDCSLAAQDKILRRNNSKEKMVFRIIIALIVLLYAMRHTVAELKKLNRQRFSYGLASPETNVPQNVSNAVASSAISEQMNCPQIEWNASSETHLKSRKSRCDFSLKNSYMNVEPSKCTCRDPFQPWDRTVEDKPHQAKVENAIAWQQSLLEEVRRSNEKVDVVFYGSSILEYWLGTYYGKTQNKKSIETFYPFFGGSAHNATLNGLIMAMSGDTTGSLWNGIATERTLPDWLEPSVIWIVIGTNDMAHFMCSADAVNFAAMKLVSHIRSMRPNAKIVLVRVTTDGKKSLTPFHRVVSQIFL